MCGGFGVAAPFIYDEKTGYAGPNNRGRTQVNLHRGRGEPTYKRTAPAADATPSTEEDLIQQLLADGKMSREQAVAAVDAALKGQMPALEQANDAAYWGEHRAVDDLTDYLNSGEQGSIDPAAYVGDLSSEASKAYADPTSREAQFGALDKLKGWSDPTITPEEKFMMEQARQDEERDQRSARSGVLRDLAARGIRSGNAEMAGLLGAAQITSQNRLLGDLGAQANAQRRALGALTSYGNLATDISGQTFDEGFKRGGAADDVAKFNNQLRTDYDMGRQKFQLEQQDSRFGRQRDLANTRVDVAGNQFGRQRDIAATALTGSGQKAAALTGSGYSDALKVALGQQEADKARKALANEEEDFNLFKPGTWF